MKNHLIKRIYAFFIDISVIYFLKFFSLVIYLKTLGTFLAAIPINNKDFFFTHLNLLDNYLLIVIFMGYFLSCFIFSHGKTLGKLLLNLEVRSSTEDETFFDQYLLRTFAYLFCYLNGIFLLLIPLFTKNGMGIPDWVSGTNVVSKSEIPVKRSEYNQNEAFDLKRPG